MTIPRLPPRDVPPDFYRLFGELDPELCVKVAEFVDWERRRMCVEMALVEIGSWPGFGFGVRKGFRLLKAGRYLVHQREGRKNGKGESAGRRAGRSRRRE